MNTFLESLKVERSRLQALVVEMEDGRLGTGHPLTTTADTINHARKQIAELTTLIATYEADNA